MLTSWFSYLFVNSLGITIWAQFDLYIISPSRYSFGFNCIENRYFFKALPYLPLSTYDVDRNAVCLLPRELCFEKCIVPFDLISRSVLIATANPFDMAARNQAEVMLAYNVFWYVTSPEEIHVALRRAHGLDTKHPQGARTPGIS